MKLLPLITWVINTTRPLTLLKGVTPYQVWFGREPLNWPHINSQNFNAFAPPPPSQSEAELGLEVGEDGEVILLDLEDDDTTEDKGEGLGKVRVKEEYLLTKLSQRVADYQKLMAERIVRNTKGVVLDFVIGECATLAVGKKQRGKTEMTRITVRVLEKHEKVSKFLSLTSILLTIKRDILFGQCMVN